MQGPQRVLKTLIQITRPIWFHFSFISFNNFNIQLIIVNFINFSLNLYKGYALLLDHQETLFHQSTQLGWPGWGS
jgi:hypothetical protein